MSRYVVSEKGDALGRYHNSEFFHSMTSSKASPARLANPEHNASWLSVFLFSYVGSTVATGAERELEEADIWDVHPDDKPDVLFAQFEPLWAEECKQPSPSLIRTIRGMMMGRYVVLFVLKVLMAGSSFAGPILLNQILLWMADPAGTKATGYGLAVILGAFALFQALIGAHFSRIMFKSIIQVRALLTTAIFRKSLKLSAAGQGKVGSSKDDSSAQSSTGQIVNLISNDADNVGMGVFTSVDLLLSPVQVIVALVLIYDLIGSSMFAGLGVMLGAFPLFGVIMFVVGNLFVEKAKLGDTRVKVMNEIMNGFRVVRFYAWETSFLKRVGAVREDEVSVLKKLNLTRAMFIVVFLMMPVLISLASFASYVNRGYPLTPSVCFGSLALFAMLRWAMINIPGALQAVVMGNVCAGRIEKLLMQQEVIADALSADDANSSNGIEIVNASFQWGAPASNETPTVAPAEGGAATADVPAEATAFTLQNVNLHARKGALTAVVGGVGSGKSSLAMACLGEMHQSSGTRRCDGPVGYVAQTAWIQNMTVRDNILFGRPFDQEKYDRVIASCSLLPDFAILPAKDATEIGEKGVNLSGGQKQRIALARAVYSDSPTLVMDDPFSAVDANVGEHIFQHCVRTELKHKTVLLITNQLHFLPRCDFVYVLNHGRIVASGTHAEIVASGFDFALLNEKQEIGHLADEHAVAAVDPAKVVVEEHAEVAKATESQPGKAAPHVEEKKADAKPQSGTKQAAGETLVEEEDRVQGSIDLTSYIKLIRAMGGWPFVLGLSFTLIVGQFFLNIADFWLGAWAARVYDQPDSYYILIHSLIALGAVVFLLLKAFVLASGAAGSSRGLHEGLIQSVMRAPSRFFDATPTGRITNRFSKDMQDLDVSIPSSIDNLVAMIVMLLANMLTTVISVSPYFLLVMVAMMLVYSKIQQYYQRSVMQLNRFEATSRSPLYSFFMESVSGCVTIRASGKQRSFIDEMEQRCENNVTKFWMLRSVFFWSTLRIESCNAVLQLGAALFVVGSNGTINPAYAGAALNQILSLGGFLGFAVNTFTMLESSMVCVERIEEYSNNIGREPEWELETDKQLAADWPSEGRIEFHEVTMRYRDALDPALRSATAMVQAHEKLGVAGRTGSGKSSLMLTLFRLYPLSAETDKDSIGKIVIDGVDISTIGVHTLRRKLGIIPQDSFMFSGTLRENLDPFGTYSDAQLWQSLADTNLKSFVEHDLPEKLDAQVSENGANFSQGQRQLVCMARALLRQPKILIMDEATSSVDPATDALIQNSVRTNFKQSTVLTIAHRLNTIADADRICVLEQGRIIELDTPQQLIEKENGVFASMWKASHSH